MCKTVSGFEPIGKTRTLSRRITKSWRSIAIPQMATAAMSANAIARISMVGYGPELMISRIAPADAAGVPAAGSVPITKPLGIVVDFWKYWLCEA